jgi:hypothetical protein
MASAEVSGGRKGKSGGRQKERSYTEGRSADTEKHIGELEYGSACCDAIKLFWNVERVHKHTFPFSCLMKNDSSNEHATSQHQVRSKLK